MRFLRHSVLLDASISLGLCSIIVDRVFVKTVT